MVVDSSILIAILLAEPEAEDYAKRLLNTDDIYISAVSIVESSMVIEYKKGEQGAIQYDELLNIIAPTIIAFDSEQAKLARAAWRKYGKGRHPAKLNFGDCCSYAVAKYLNKPLLFKGDDFSKTDLIRA
ncbi:MAG: type II toxin-antitoxin system VapC family toxin [Methylococcales bacterium]|nr:type II toxin-antitoxin system VapC family toxin [Methylococcales bacterium]